MRSTVFLLTALLTVLSISTISPAQIATDDREEITLTTYYPAPYGNYHRLSVSGSITGSGTALDINPAFTADDVGNVFNAVRIRPTFNDAGFINIQHNSLIVENGNVGIGTASPATTLDVNGLIRAGSYNSTGSNPPPNPSLNEGAIYYEASTDNIHYSNGASWQRVGGSAPVGFGVLNDVDNDGTADTIVLNHNYTAPTDGILWGCLTRASENGGSGYIQISVNVIPVSKDYFSAYAENASVFAAVKKGEIWSVRVFHNDAEPTTTVSWMPLQF